MHLGRQLRRHESHHFARMLLVLAMSLMPVSGQAKATKSRFPTCNNRPSQQAPPPPPESCGAEDEDPLPLSDLRSHGAQIQNSLAATVSDIRDTHRFSRKLELAVFQQLDASLEKYERFARCDASCAPGLQEMIDRLTPQLMSVRTELSIMQPDDLSPGAMGRSESWFSLKPKHPFSQSPELQLLTKNEREATREIFVHRLAAKVPSVAARADKILSNGELLAQSRSEEIAVGKAMIQVQSEARENYLKLIGNDALLIFLSDAHLPLTVHEIVEASAKLKDQIAKEKTRLNAIKDPIAKSEAFIQYHAAADSILKTEPGLCGTADKWAEQAEALQSRRQLTIAAGQVAASFAAFALCSTVVGCAFTAAAVSTVDFGIAKADANEAFKSGVAKAARPDVAREHFATDAMTTADSAARFEYATLAMSVPTIVKSGVEAVRSTNTALKALEITKGPAVTKGRFVNEVVGGPERSRLNIVAQTFYRDLLEPYVGREREIVETLIERMQAKGIPPEKISTTLKDRIRQCAF